MAQSATLDQGCEMGIGALVSLIGPITGLHLDSYLGKNISDICPNGYSSPSFNHCAHFVNHALSLTFGYTCATATGKASGVNLRVHELFQKCPIVGAWKDRTADPCICFVIAPGEVNVKRHLMTNVPKKHVGIYCMGKIWHYSNLHHRVQKENPEQFIKHYPHQTNALFFGKIPLG